MTPLIQAKFKLNYAKFCLDVDVSLPGTGVTVLFGDSGSGKTTLLRCIAGLQKAPYGFLEINQQVWQNSSLNIFLPTHKRPLGYVFQEANLFPHLSVAGNLQFGLKRIGKRLDADHVQPILNLLGIEHLLNRRPDGLSGGERQRVAIARALVLNPELLLMDEPLASLDNKRKQEFLPFLVDLHSQLNIPVLYVTHSRQEVAQLADYLLLLKNGQVEACGELAVMQNKLNDSYAVEREATSIWEVTVLYHEQDFYLTHVDFGGGKLYLPFVNVKQNTRIRIQINASDVSISLSLPSGSSILNILSATVQEINSSDYGLCKIRLRVGLQNLVALITRKSLGMLNLQAGMEVYVQIKGSSILN